MRMHGHGAHDDMSYVPEELLEEWSHRDPIEMYSSRLTDEHGFSSDEVEGIRASVEAYVDECAEEALASPMPDPSIAFEGVFADSWEPLGTATRPGLAGALKATDHAPNGNGRPAPNGHGRASLVEHGRAA